MSQQIQITGGAKVRDLQDVIIGTSGVLSSVAFNVANGVPKLDVNGKILVSQLPNSVMEYKGVWNAATNSPTLTNGGAFNQGDVYLCDTAGTVNFGSGSPISFIVGDQAIYSGSVWQKAGGATGTVTSVAVTESGDSLNITGSPITTSGTINIGFNGTNLQYVNGAGNLTTFPILTGFVPYTGATTSVDLGAFLLTASGVDSVGYTARGSGTLSGYLILKQGTTFLGNVVGYNSINANSTKYTFISDVDGTNYKQASFELGSLTNNTARTYTLPNANGTIALTSDIPILTGYVPYTGATANVDLGTFNLTADVITGATGSFTSNGGSDTFAINHSSGAGIALNITKGGNGEGLYINKTSGSGNAATIIGTLNATTLVKSGGTSSQFLKADGTVDSSTYALDSAVVHNTGNETVGGTKTFSDATKNNGGIFLQNASSNSLAGYMNLGGLTNGLKFTSGGGISNTFTLPSATGYTFTFPNATGTIALTSDLSDFVTLSTAQTISGTKTFTSFTKNDFGVLLNASGNYTAASGYNGFGGISNGIRVVIGQTAIHDLVFSALANYTYTFPSATGTIALVGGSGVGTVISVAALTIGTSGTDLSSSVANSTTTPVITLNVPTASATNRGALSSADWTTFNNKQSALTIGNLGSNDTNFLSVTGGAGSVIGSGVTLYVYPYNIVSSGLTLTTTGSSGAATKVTNTLNIPTYTLSGLGGIGGSGDSGYLPKFTGASTIGNSLVRDDGSGVSIGFAPQTDKLFIYNASGTNNALQIQQDGTGDIIRLNGNGGANRLVLQQGGNLGLGVTPSAWTLGKAIEIGNIGNAIWGVNATQFNILHNAYYNGGYVYASSNPASYYQQSSGNHTWYNAPSGTAGNAITFTQAMTLDASGNLMLGGTSSTGYWPANLTQSSAKQIIQYNDSTTNLNNANAGLVILNSNTTAATSSKLVFAAYNNDPVGVGLAYISAVNSTRSSGYLTGDLIFGTSSGGTTGAVERMRITSDGKLLLGNPTASTYMLDVNGTGRFSGQVQLMTHFAAYSDAEFMGVLGFNRNPSTGAIYNNARAAFQLQNHLGTFQVKAFSSAGADLGTPLSIASTGAATFSSSVEAGGGFISNNDSNTPVGFYKLKPSSVTTARWWRITSDNVVYGDFSIAQSAANSDASYSNKLYFNATGAATFSSTCTATGFFESSDSRLKTLIQDNYQTKGIASITPKLYTKNGKVELGYYAQDFIGILDSAVSKGSDDMLSLSYREVLVAKVYALEQEIKELKAKIN